jgi:hypothetical protein
VAGLREDSFEDAQWVAARREGTLLLREAAAMLRQGENEEAVAVCQQAAELFEGEVRRGVGAAAETMLMRAVADAKAASEAMQQQSEARAEAVRLSSEAEQWLKNGDLEQALILSKVLSVVNLYSKYTRALTFRICVCWQALILAERAQAALNEVEQFFGRISTAELTRVLDIKLRVQEKQQMRKGTVTLTPVEGTAAAKRQALEDRQRQKLIEKKREDARKKREGSAASGEEVGKKETVKDDDWKAQKDLGASLDRAARQALKEGKYQEAADLAQRAVEYAPFLF